MVGLTCYYPFGAEGTTLKIPMLAHLRRRLGLIRSLITYWRPGRQRPLQKLYRPFIAPGDRVFDIGAHLGDRSAAFAALGARVVAVEPQPEFQAWLQRLVGFRGFRDSRYKVEIVPEAVGCESGTAQLAISYANPTVSSMAGEWRDTLQRSAPGFRHVRWEETVTVPVTTLDALIGRFGAPRFCKIDVEGFEVQVLAGLSYPIEALSFEFITGALDQAMLCLAELDRLGVYEFNAIAGEGRDFIWPQWQSREKAERWLEAGVDGIASGDLYARLVARPGLELGNI